MNDSLQRKMAGVLLSLIILGLTWLLAWDRKNIDRDIQALKKQDIVTSGAIGVIQQDEAVAKVQHDYLVLSVNELKDGQKEMNRKIDVLVKR